MTAKKTSTLAVALLCLSQVFTTTTAGAAELPPSTTIQLDGSLDEWAATPSVGAGLDVPDDPGNDVDLLALKMTHDAETLFVAYENESPITLGWHYAVYFDADRDPGTGFSTGSVGIDLLIEGRAVYRYTGSGTDWSWQYVQQLDAAVSGNTAELAIPRTLLGTGLDFFFFGQGGLETIPLQPGALAYAFDASGLFVDGSLDDWTGIASLGAGLDVPDASGNEVDLLALKLTHDESTLFVAYENEGPIVLGWSYALYIDADRNPGTGFATGAIGADYLIEGSSAYRYTGSGSDWSWQYVQPLSSAVTGNTAELAIPRTLLGTGAGLDFFFFGQGGLETIPLQPGALAYAFHASGVFVDGSLDDWTDVASLGAGLDVPDTPENEVDLLALKLTHDESTLFVAYENEGPIALGWPYALYVDADRDPGTGFEVDGLGTDYLIEGSLVYQYTGSGSDWSWQFVQQLSAAVSGKTAELAVPRALLGTGVGIDFFFVGQGGLERIPGDSTWLTYVLNPAANGRPRAMNAQYVTEVATPVSIELQGFDPEGEPLGYQVETLPAHGVLSGSAPSLTYTPEPGFVGVDSFSFSASDWMASSAKGTVTIRVPAPPTSIVVDGQLDDWAYIASMGSGLDVLDEPANRVDLLELKLTHDAQSLFVAYQNESPLVLDEAYALYIDTDNDAATGWRVNGIGAELLIEGAVAYAYTGSGDDSSWQQTADLAYAVAGNSAELSIPRSLLGVGSSVDWVFKGQGGLESVPSGDVPMVQYRNYPFGNTTRLEFGPNPAIPYSIAYDALGNAFAVWVEERGGGYYAGGENAVWVNRYSPATGWATPQELDVGGALDVGGDWSASPDFKVHPNGNAILLGHAVQRCWTSGCSSYLWDNTTVYDAKLGRWSPARQLGEVSKSAAIDSDGNVIVVACGFEDAPLSVPPPRPWSCFSDRYVAGEGWVERETLSSSGSSPRIAFDDAGNAMAAWLQDGNVWTKRYVPAEGWGAAERLLPDSAADVDGALGFVVDASGNAIATWPHIVDGLTQVWTSRYSVETGRWGTAEALSDPVDSASMPSFSVDPDGNTIAAWTEEVGGRVQLVTKRYGAAERSWSARTLLESIAGACQPTLGCSRTSYGTRLQLEADPAGNTVAVWYAMDASGVLANRYDASLGAWGSTERLGYGGPGDSPAVSFAANGDPIVVWGFKNMLARRYFQAEGRWSEPESIHQDVSNYNIASGPSGERTAFAPGPLGSQDLWVKHTQTNLEAIDFK